MARHYNSIYSTIRCQREKKLREKGEREREREKEKAETKTQTTGQPVSHSDNLELRTFMNYLIRLLEASALFHLRCHSFISEPLLVTLEQLHSNLFLCHLCKLKITGNCQYKDYSYIIYIYIYMYILNVICHFSSKYLFILLVIYIYNNNNSLIEILIEINSGFK